MTGLDPAPTGQDRATAGSGRLAASCLAVGLLVACVGWGVLLALWAVFSRSEIGSVGFTIALFVLALQGLAIVAPTIAGLVVSHKLYRRWLTRVPRG